MGEAFDPEPQPSDGPDHHAEHEAWKRRNHICAHGRRGGHWAVDELFMIEYWCEARG